MLPQFTLVEHLTEIRKRLIKTLIAFIAIFIYVYTKTDQLIDFILDMATKIDFIYTKPEELLMSYLKLDFLAALLLTVPIFMFQCWRFVLRKFRELYLLINSQRKLIKNNLWPPITKIQASVPLR